MTKLDEAMLQHMSYLVLSENRPFSYSDFTWFKVDQNEHGMKHGTFRNKISKLIKDGQVEVCYYSSCAFYTLKGFKFGKAMTPNHTVVHNDPIYKMLQDLPLDKQSIHDIRLRFRVPNIWKIFSFNTNFPSNKRSKDIVIPSWNKNNAIVRTMIHKTDLVSVIVACSLEPIPLDVNGIIRFFTLLAIVQEKLQTVLDSATAINCGEKCNTIPEYRTWLISMWHFGRDALVEYVGEKFSITVECAQHILTRLYVKEFSGIKKIRIERQEYPQKTLTDAIDEKLKNSFY